MANDPTNHFDWRATEIGGARQQGLSQKIHSGGTNLRNFWKVFFANGIFPCGHAVEIRLVTHLGEYIRQILPVNAPFIRAWRQLGAQVDLHDPRMTPGSPDRLNFHVELPLSALDIHD